MRQWRFVMLSGLAVLVGVGAYLAHVRGPSDNPEVEASFLRPGEDDADISERTLKPTERGWTEDDADNWKHLAQGSMLVPLSIFLTLQSPVDPDGSDDRRFFAPTNLERFGFIPDGDVGLPSSLPTFARLSSRRQLTIDGLAIGFALEQVGRYPVGRVEPLVEDFWVGLTCSACHTRRWKIPSDQGLRGTLVYGAGGRMEFVGFLNGLLDAYEATLPGAGSCGRGAQTCLADADPNGECGPLLKMTTAITGRSLPKLSAQGRAITDEDVLRVQRTLAALCQRQNTYNQGASPSPPSPGTDDRPVAGLPGRMDAWGNLFNRLEGVLVPRGAVLTAAPTAAPGPVNAPVSIPNLWRPKNPTQEHEGCFQWNGSFGGEDANDQMGRAAGQAIGSFAMVDLERPRKHGGPLLGGGVWSTFRVNNLKLLTQQLRELEPPDYPAKPPEDGEVTRGAHLYANHCMACHGHVDRQRLEGRCQNCHSGEPPRRGNVNQDFIDPNRATSCWTRTDAHPPGAGIPSGKTGRPAIVTLANATVSQGGIACRADTDPVMAVNYRDRIIDAGALQGRPACPGPRPCADEVGGSASSTKTLGSKVRGGELLRYAVVAGVVGRGWTPKKPPNEVEWEFRRTTKPGKRAPAGFGGERTFETPIAEPPGQGGVGPRAFDIRHLPPTPDAVTAPALYCAAPSESEAEDLGLQYKVPNLTGLWATAPYLHNGSVPTLRGVIDSAQRPKTFCVGSEVFDEVNVGESVPVQGADGLCPAGTALFDTEIPGNGNAGHEKLPMLSGCVDDPDCLKENAGRVNDLLEFLKLF